MGSVGHEWPEVLQVTLSFIHDIGVLEELRLSSHYLPSLANGLKVNRLQLIRSWYGVARRALTSFIDELSQ